MRNQRGITLIALVITIIVLLILAGVSIAMLTGQNGVLTKATDADVATEKAGIADKVNMAIQAAYADAVIANTSNPSLTVNAIAAQYRSDNGITAAGDVVGTEPTEEPVAPATLTIKNGTTTYTVTLTEAGNSYTTTSANVSISTTGQ